MKFLVLFLTFIHLAWSADATLEVIKGVEGLSPLAIAGHLLGGAILLVIISAFAGWKLPLVQNETQAVAAVSDTLL